MNRSFDNELDDILVGVDLTSSPGREPDLSPELSGVERSHPNETSAQRDWHPKRRPEGNCDREGALATNAPSVLTIFPVTVVSELWAVSGSNMPG